MAFFFEETNRLVLPNWRSFANTAKIGELNGSKKLLIEKSFNPDITDIIDGWIDSQTIGMAGDLLGVAIVCNKEDDPNVINAAKFIKANPEISSRELLSTANIILNNGKVKEKTILDSDKFESFQERANLFFVYERISDLKRKLRINPKNSILWIEIARFYSIIGQNMQAERAIKNAFQISPENRFVLRAMARFYTHIGKVDYAHDIIRKLPITKYDPWIMATEISLAMKRGRFSRFIKPAFNMVNSSDFHPFNISELNSSLGTLEMESSLKKSKKLFNDSLIKPNDNSLAQAEWISHKESNFLRVNPSEYEIENNYEAKARDASEHGKWQDSVDYAKLWFLDMPFSRDAILFGSEVAANNLNNHDEAENLYKAGLTSHPNDSQMLNNIVYSMCLNNRFSEAEKYLNKFKFLDNQASIDHQICIIATKGLYYFRKGLPDIGRTYYFDAINKASEENKQLLANIAFVNYVREEYLLGSDIDDEIKNKITELRKNSQSKTIKKIIAEIDSISASQI